VEEGRREARGRHRHRGGGLCPLLTECGLQVGGVLARAYMPEPGPPASTIGADYVEGLAHYGTDVRLQNAFYPRGAALRRSGLKCRENLGAGGVKAWRSV